MPRYIENDTIKYHVVTRTSENCYQAFYYPISNRLYSVPRVQKITKGKWKYVHIYVLFIAANRLYSIPCKSLHINSFNFGIPIKELLIRLFKQRQTQGPKWIIQFSLFFFFSLKYKYNCFKMLWYFLLYNMNQSYVCIYPLLGLPSRSLSHSSRLSQST